jgi:hypothetical protein
MVVKTRNGITMQQRPHYDARMTAKSVIDSVNMGYIYVNEAAGSIHWKSRGWLYSAVRGDKGKFVLDGIPAKEVKS